MTLTINGNAKELPLPCSVSELLQALNIRPSPERPSIGIAVAVNDTVVPKSEYGHYLLQDSDRVEIIRPVGGG